MRLQSSRGGGGEGRRIVRASWAGTAVFALSAGAAATTSDLEAVGVAVAIALFSAGLLIFIVAFSRAVGRSRTDEIAVTSLFFLAGSAPRPVQRSLMGSLATEVVVAIVTASVRPYTSLAFGVLVPVYGLALAGLWAARHGRFPARQTGRRPTDGTLGRSDG